MSRKKNSPGATSPDPQTHSDAEPNDELFPVGTGTLASIEAGSDMEDGVFDLDAARARLAPVPVPEDGTTSSETPEPIPEVGKRPRGRPRGSGRRRSGTAKVAGGEDPAKRAQELEETAAAIGGTVQFLVAAWAGARPERQGWTLTENEAARLGELWAVPLAPYLPALGAATPWVLAAFGTGKLAMDKAKQAREVVAALPPEQAPAEGTGNGEAHRGSIA